MLKCKKIELPLLIIVISNILFSCVNFNINLVETIPEETRSLEEKTMDMMDLSENSDVASKKEFITIENIRYEDKENGKLYCESSYDKLNISDNFAFKNQTLTNALLTFNKKSDNEAKKFIEQYKVEVREMIKERNDDTLILSSESAVNIIRNDDKVLSFTNGIYSYTGGAHGNFGTICYNYDIISGEELKTKDIFTNMDLLYERLIKELAKQEDEYEEIMLLFEEYPKTIKDMINQNEEFSIILYDDAVEVLFDPYLIGPWSSSTITVRFNYEDNKDLINNNLF